MAFTKKETQRLNKIVAMIESGNYSTAFDFLSVISNRNNVTIDADLSVIPLEVLEDESELDDMSELEGPDDLEYFDSDDFYPYGKEEDKDLKVEVEVEVETGSSENSVVESASPDIEEKYLSDIAGIFDGGSVKDYAHGEGVTSLKEKSKTSVTLETKDILEYKNHTTDLFVITKITVAAIDIEYSFVIKHAKKEDYPTVLPDNNVYSGKASFKGKPVFDEYLDMIEDVPGYAVKEGATLKDTYLPSVDLVREDIVDVVKIMIDSESNIISALSDHDISIKSK